MDKVTLLKQEARKEEIIQKAIAAARKKRDDDIIRAQAKARQDIFDAEVKRRIEEALKEDEMRK